jgi:hypothetical protein
MLMGTLSLRNVSFSVLLLTIAYTLLIFVHSITSSRAKLYFITMVVIKERTILIHNLNCEISNINYKKQRVFIKTYQTEMECLGTFSKKCLDDLLFLFPLKPNLHFRKQMF